MTQKLFYLLLLSLLLQVGTQKISAQSDKEKGTEALKIFSWNIYMLPATASFSKEIGKINRRKRAKAIADYILEEDFDIIVWQEIFNRAARRKLKRKLKKRYRFQYGPANQNLLSFNVSSGISFFSKVPLKNKKSIKFSNCLGSDCWARKGALSMDGEWNGKEFQLIGTHLQAAGDCQIRLEQAREIRDKLLIPNQKEGKPQIVAGDMNIHQGWKEYQELLEIFGVEDYQYADTVKATNTGNPGYIIDFIFAKDNGAEIHGIQRAMYHPERSWAEEKKWLSDHRAIFVKIIF